MPTCPVHPIDGLAQLTVLLAVAIAVGATGCKEAMPPERVAVAHRIDVEPATGAEVLVNDLGMRFVPIPAGRFRIGAPVDEPGRQVNEGPRREIVISRPFHLAAYETTVGQFRAFVAATGYRTEAERDLGGGYGIDFETARVRQDPTVTWRNPGFPDGPPDDNHPVVLVSWADADAFCRWLSARDGRRCRLPTEAEWAYAARAGTGTVYWCGDDPTCLAGTANVADAALRRALPAVDRAAPWDDGFAFLAPVGSFEPNPWGLYDVHGNAWEWCLDGYDAAAYQRMPDVDPLVRAAGPLRSIRGGGWFNGPERNRSAQRVYFEPRFRYCLLSGFRVLVETDDADPSAGRAATAGLLH